MAENYPNPNIDPATRQHVPGGEHQLSPEDAVLAAAREVVDQAAGDVAKDAPAGQPLPEHAFSPEEAVAEATNAAVREGLTNTAAELAHDAVAVGRDRFSAPIEKWRQIQSANRRAKLSKGASFIARRRAFGGGAPKSQSPTPETGSGQDVDK